MTLEAVGTPATRLPSEQNCALRSIPCCPSSRSRRHPPPPPATRVPHSGYPRAIDEREREGLSIELSREVASIVSDTSYSSRLWLECQSRWGGSLLFTVFGDREKRKNPYITQRRLSTVSKNKSHSVGFFRVFLLFFLCSMFPLERDHKTRKDHNGKASSIAIGSTV